MRTKGDGEKCFFSVPFGLFYGRVNGSSGNAGESAKLTNGKTGMVQ